MAGPSKEDLERCQANLGHGFKDPELLAEALSHASSRTAFSSTNERLEFLGDSILGFVVSLHLYTLFPEADEGWMTKIKSHVVSRRNLALKARELGIANFVVVGKMFPTPRDVTNSILSNCFEAIIAAVYLDGGFDAAFEFVLRHLGTQVVVAAQDPGHRDFKSQLGQYAQRAAGSHPTYALLSTAGPDHTKVFEVAAAIGDRRFAPAWGRSKKEAEQRAAFAALRELGLA